MNTKDLIKTASSVLEHDLCRNRCTEVQIISTVFKYYLKEREKKSIIEMKCVLSDLWHFWGSIYRLFSIFIYKNVFYIYDCDSSFHIVCVLCLQHLLCWSRSTSSGNTWRSRHKWSCNFYTSHFNVCKFHDNWQLIVIIS